MTHAYSDEWFVEKEIPITPLWLKIVLLFCPTKISKEGKCTTLYKTFRGHKIITGIIWHFAPFIIPIDLSEAPK